jgi:hypothetical protein
LGFSIDRSRGLLIAGGALLWLGCQEEQGKRAEEAAADPCADQELLGIENPDALSGDPDYLAELTIDELDELDASGGHHVSTVISAVFADVTEYDQDLTPAIQFNPACVGILGPPEAPEGVSLITLEGVSVSTPVLGERDLERDDNGRFLPLIEEAVLSREGGETIAARATSSGEEGTFPGFEATLVAPPAIQGHGTSKSEDGTLHVSWEPAVSTYLEVVLRTEGERSEMPERRVRCYLLEDDGCYRVPADAVAWLAVQSAATMRVRLERHALALVVPEKKALAKIDAMRSIEYIINVI